MLLPSSNIRLQAKGHRVELLKELLLEVLSLRRNEVSSKLTPYELPWIVNLIIVLIVLLCLKVSWRLPTTSFAFLLCTASPLGKVRYRGPSLLLLCHKSLELRVIKLGLSNVEVLLLLLIGWWIINNLFLRRLHRSKLHSRDLLSNWCCL